MTWKTTLSIAVAAGLASVALLGWKPTAWPFPRVGISSCAGSAPCPR